MQDYGSVTLMPISGTAPGNLSEDSYSSTFRKATEISRPYVYSVHLDRYNVSASVTALSHTVAAKFLFQEAGERRRYLLIKINNLYGEGTLSANLSAGTVVVRSPVRPDPPRKREP
jgi:hypothetical protein